MKSKPHLLYLSEFTHFYHDGKKHFYSKNQSTSYVSCVTISRENSTPLILNHQPSIHEMEQVSFTIGRRRREKKNRQIQLEAFLDSPYLEKASQMYSMIVVSKASGDFSLVLLSCCFKDTTFSHKCLEACNAIYRLPDHQVDLMLLSALPPYTFLL